MSLYMYPEYGIYISISVLENFVDHVYIQFFTMKIMCIQCKTIITIDCFS